MSEVLDLPAIDPALIDKPAQPRTEVAVAAAAALDLQKIDLTDVALAQFGPWRANVAATVANIGTLALDLSNQTRIDEAKTLRNRLIGQPRAEIRKVSKDLKSKLAKVSKAIGAEEEAAVLAYDGAEKPLTDQIDAAQKLIDDEKAAKAAAEAARLQGLREAVDGIMAKWLERCNIEGITAERIAKGGDLFSAMPMPAEVADVSVYWDTKVGTTLAEMRKLHGAALAREEAARLDAQRIENERIAAEQARVAAELAAQQRALAEQAAALARQAEEIEAARQRAITPAAPAATEGKADTPDPGTLEAAPVQRSGGQPIVMGAAVASGPLHPSTEDTTSGAAPGGTKAYIHPDTDDHGADLWLDPGTAAAEAAEFAELEALADGPPGGFVTCDLLDACADFVALVAQARFGSPPAQPNMGPDWWAALYSAADRIQATGEVL